MNRSVYELGVGDSSGGVDVAAFYAGYAAVHGS